MFFLSCSAFSKVGVLNKFSVIYNQNKCVQMKPITSAEPPKFLISNLMFDVSDSKNEANFQSHSSEKMPHNTFT